MLACPPEKATFSSTVIRDDFSSTLQFNEVNEDFKDFKATLHDVVESNLRLLDEIPLPEWLRIEDVKAFFRQQAEKDLTQDPLFEKSVELAKYANNMGKLMEPYFANIFEFNKNRIESLHSKVFWSSKMFLNSDLPMAFMTAIGDSMLAEIDYIEIFNKEIRREYLDLIRNRSNRTKFERVIDVHNSWVRSFSDLRDKMEHQRVKLIWYVDLCNSKNMNAIFKDKFLQVGNLNRETLFVFTHDLKIQVQEMENLNFKHMQFCFPSPRIDDETEAFMRMINVLQGTRGTM